MKPTNEQNHVQNVELMESLMLKGISTNINSMHFPQIKNLNEMLDSFGYTVQKKSSRQAEKLVERYSHWVINELQPDNIQAFINLILDYSPEEKELMLLMNSGIKDDDLWIVKQMVNNPKIGVTPSTVFRHLGKTYHIGEMKNFLSLKEFINFLDGLDSTIIVYSLYIQSGQPEFSLRYSGIPKITENELKEAAYESVLTENTTKLTRITFEYYNQNSNYFKDGYPAYYSILDGNNKQTVHVKKIPLEFRYDYEEKLVNRKLKGHIPDMKQFDKWLSDIEKRDNTKTPDEKTGIEGMLVKEYHSSKESLDMKQFEKVLEMRMNQGETIDLMTLYDTKEKYHILLDNFISYLINDEQIEPTEDQVMKILFVLKMMSTNPHVGVCTLPIFRHSGKFYSIGADKFDNCYDLIGFIHNLDHDIIAYHFRINDKNDSIILRYSNVITGDEKNNLIQNTQQ